MELAKPGSMAFSVVSRRIIPTINCCLTYWRGSAEAFPSGEGGSPKG